jgi:hypothetical protein
MKKRLLVSIFCAALVALATTTCVVSARPPRGAVYVRVAPPAPLVEVEGVAPGPEFVWIRGYHRWEGERYVWVPGRWERRPRAGAVWVHGEWRHHRNGWYWVEGHWR